MFSKENNNLYENTIQRDLSFLNIIWERDDLWDGFISSFSQIPVRKDMATPVPRKLGNCETHAFKIVTIECILGPSTSVPLLFIIRIHARIVTNTEAIQKHSQDEYNTTMP